MTEVESYVEGANDRFTIKGPSLLLDPRRPLALGLVFHELTTNVAKYGALSKAKGRVAVTWAAKKGFLVVDWLESDGPKVRGAARLRHRAHQAPGKSLRWRGSAQLSIWRPGGADLYPDRGRQ